ncbi:Uncharacterized protein C16C4.19 [Choanephora cucurbitarum]|uniref:Uncharacterized protein C16C4.19 n=1 Tax=Choanephora cucurbitarum TaxID=101091 RepID=A0A1C7N1V4_9FUNG|nr:Uncharacterized protein C16C4.19 [Choanephora cucurbitarum]
MTTNTLQTHQQTQRLDHLFTAGYSMFTSCPSLSRYYMSEFQNTLIEYDLTSATERLACSSCGQIMVPGLNQKTRLISKRRKNKPNKSTLQITCLTCSRVKVYHGSHKKKLPMSVEQQPSVPVVEPMKKKKKNNNHKNSLKALLSKPKAQQNMTNSNLSDFLSSL